jgi:hypothetical protein
VRRSEIEAEGAEAQLAAGRGCILRHAPQDGADAQDELARLEGLGQIVVGAGLEAGDAVLRLAHGGEQQDGHAVLLAERARQFEAAFAGHHDVEHEEIEGEAVELAARVDGIGRDGDAETLLGEIFPQQLAQALVRRRRREMWGGSAEMSDGHRGDYSAGCGALQRGDCRPGRPSVVLAGLGSTWGERS